MRIVYTLNNPKQARTLSSFLTNEGIENQLEILEETDWGSQNYSDVTCHIWVIDEDCVDAAMRWIDLFKQDSENPLFYQNSKPQEPLSAKAPSVVSKLKLIKTLQKTQTVKPPGKETLGRVTIYILLLCTILFFITEMTTPKVTSYPSYLPAMPIFSAPLQKKLLYDYPNTYELVDKLVSLYGTERLKNPEELPEEGKHLLNQFHKTPYWTGYYDEVLSSLQSAQPSRNGPVPMFEKLHQGQFWRLLSPCFLHAGILHIVFNMIWLLILGKQMEERLGAPRYLIFIIATGIFSNTAQYLMGGPNFIGFSGVVCAMLGFIWARQKTAPWEGYQLDRTTLIFMLFFILSMFSIQLVSFYLEVNGNSPISPGIANTAHLSGAAFGYLLGRLSIFNWKT